ncbi:DMT family transporter [Burkholderia multivorans]|uniref:DMT family transporter n=1 Tax=Burkholderia multivorans TaxID=87883 RepID=UPI0012DEE76D|nr:DMT family transporter [Burkholderia multivorans]MBU9340642.1 DMT family transporter [Burkholderia multivorans]MBU9609462.1 DMT family transporter [Burkholderia multivorans]MBU9624709.1 DMT family transporter [Burkholderia multivorans]MCA8140837.1 DMT family transporter [Burkholderia multivorans]MCO1367236.1 DMT family transporter [Burkholderia multivorans]
MSPKNALLLTVLAALWGASFLFIRVGVAEFGVAPLMALRVGIGALFLTAFALTRFPAADLAARLRRHAGPLFVVGVLNSGAPFCLFAFAELTLSAGVTSVINATTPLWGALVAYLWLKDKLSWLRALGLVIGFAGVLTLVWDQVATAHGDVGAGTTALAAAAALGATLLYGIAANYTKRKLGGVDPLINATGSMIGSTVLLVPFAIATWPAAAVSAHAWGAVLALGIACTGVAYFIFFFLISHIGPARAITVTFVIPVFGLLWGALFLGEQVSIAMVEGCAIVLVGTALATGAIKRIPGIGPRGGEAA